MQWLINLVAERVINTIGVPPCYIDRGDPAIVDFIIGAFTTDGNWHELDLSAIVPENAKAISATVNLKAGNVLSEFGIRIHGNANDESRSRAIIQVADLLFAADFICGVNTDRKIDYKSTPDFLSIWGIIDLTIKGWWL